MKKIIVNSTYTKATHGYVLPMSRRKINHIFLCEGEEIMSAAEEFKIYYRLAKEIIESRLDADPTRQRVEHLARAMQTVEAS